MHGIRKTEATGLDRMNCRVKWGSVEIFSLYSHGVGDPNTLVFLQKLKLKKKKIELGESRTW